MKRAFTIGLALVWMAALASPARGQSGWPSYPNNGSISVTASGDVGIGTTSPGAKLDVVGTVRANDGTVFTLIAPYSGAISYIGNTSNHPLGFITNAAERLRINAGGGGYWIGGNVGIGTTNPQYLLAVNGAIGAKDVTITNAITADYVFKPGYRLRPLSEVDKFIQVNGHLPDIPSEAEVKAQGVSVGEMQAKLLAKIEELTLHMIRQEKENRELRERVRKLESRTAER